jgi:hypothetical protein
MKEPNAQIEYEVLCAMYFDITEEFPPDDMDRVGY